MGWLKKVLGICEHKFYETYLTLPIKNNKKEQIRILMCPKCGLKREIIETINYDNKV